MKKIICLFMGSLFLVGCNQALEVETLENSMNEPVVQNYSNQRTLEEAITVAENNANRLFGVKSRSSRVADKSNVKYIASAITRGANDTLMYIINFVDDKGFAVVSAKKNTDDIIAVIEDGHFAGIDSLNPGAKWYMEIASDYILNASVNSTIGGPVIPKPIEPEKPKMYFEEFDTTYNVHQEPLITVKFGQNWPEGHFCSNGYSGCTATAAAMIMHYFKLPQSMTLTYPERDINYIELDWDEIGKHNCKYQATVDYCDADVDSHYNLARLCREIGHRADADYNTDGTGVNKENSYKMFTNTGLNATDLRDYIYFSSIHTIKPGAIMLLRGNDKKQENGHTFVVDGYDHLQTTYTTYYGYYNDLGVFVKEIESYSENNTAMIHINWGWNGVYNGYYNEGAFNPKYCKIPDLSIPGIEYPDIEVGYNLQYRTITKVN